VNSFVPSQNSGTEERPKKLNSQDTEESSSWARLGESHTKGKIQLDKFYARQMSISENSTNSTANSNSNNNNINWQQAKRGEQNDNENQS